MKGGVLRVIFSPLSLSPPSQSSILYFSSCPVLRLQFSSYNEIHSIFKKRASHEEVEDEKGKRLKEGMKARGSPGQMQTQHLKEA